MCFVYNITSLLSFVGTVWYSTLPAGLSLSFESPVALIFTPVTNVFVSELYQQQASSPVTSRPHQAYSAVTGVTALNDSPALVYMYVKEKKYSI